MSTETKVIEDQATTAAPQTTSLPEILNRIHGDSQDQPEMYLEETEVPHGGE